jgi:hypothetical protein
MAVVILLIVATALFRWPGHTWPVTCAKLLAVVVYYLVALYVVFGIVIVGLS